METRLAYIDILVKQFTYSAVYWLDSGSQVGLCVFENKDKINHHGECYRDAIF